MLRLLDLRHGLLLWLRLSLSTLLALAFLRLLLRHHRLLLRHHRLRLLSLRASLPLLWSLLGSLLLLLGSLHHGLLLLLLLLLLWLNHGLLRLSHWLLRLLLHVRLMLAILELLFFFIKHTIKLFVVVTVLIVILLVIVFFSKEIQVFLRDLVSGCRGWEVLNSRGGLTENTSVFGLLSLELSLTSLFLLSKFGLALLVIGWSGDLRGDCRLSSWLKRSLPTLLTLFALFLTSSTHRIGLLLTSHTRLLLTGHTRLSLQSIMTIVSLRMSNSWLWLVITGRCLVALRLVRGLLVTSCLVTSHEACTCRGSRRGCRSSRVRVRCLSHTWGTWCTWCGLVSSSDTSTNWEVVRHGDANIDVSSLIVVVSAELELHILVNLELDVVALI